MAGFLVESLTESRMVCPRENEVSVQANISFIGVKRSGRNQDAVPGQANATFIDVMRSGRS
jgi:hypothetical protein